MASATTDTQRLHTPDAPGGTSGDAPAAQPIATLRDRDEVDGVFACTRKERQISRTGSPYLTIELTDSSGTILARAFNDADVLAGRFERGELVHVRGRAERWRERLQVTVEAIARARDGEADLASFLPTARRDLDELEGFLEHLSREVYDPSLKLLVAAILGDRDLRVELRRAPCSVPTPAGSRAGGAHHAYLGGLLEHTVAVATMAIELCTLHTRLDRDLLLTAAIVHDLGKTREFTYGAEIGAQRRGTDARPRRALAAHDRRACATLARRAAAPRARALRAAAPWLRRRRRRAFRLARGDRAAPDQRARRERQGGLRARSRRAGRLSEPRRSSPAASLPMYAHERDRRRDRRADG